MKYRYFLFDLDNTLWDFDVNAKECIAVLIKRHALTQYLPDPAAFYKMYKSNNQKLWTMYEAGEITQQKLRYVRFVITLREAGVPDPDQWGPVFGQEYLELMPSMTRLIANALNVLEYLSAKGCKMALLTNGFKQVQYDKIRNSGLDTFFRNRVFISEEVGYHKPHPKMFTAAITSINGKKKETLMVGDNYETDIEGARIFGIDQYYYNPSGNHCNGSPTYMGKDLRDLMDLV